ncbi:LacI family transcriptional regulator [Marinilongibacter aquaticus]|nr:LacI family transcriptional regulator [Marinilongibacter aquaticus]
MNKEVTIYDLAEKLGLSPSTVSRALNDHPALNENTKAKVNAAAKKYGYQLNHFAKNLRKKSTNTLGVIVPKLDSYFMANVLGGMEKVANKAGYNLIIAQSLESEKKEQANAVTLYNSRVDGLLVSASFDTQTTSHFEPFINKNIPTLFFDRHLNLSHVPKIIIDNFQAGYDATKHLIECGRKNIWHVTGSLQRNVYSDRLKGYQQALKDFGLSSGENGVKVCNLKMEECPAIVKAIAQSETRPDGIFVSNDAFAANIMTSIKHLGMDVPKDVSIVGFNDDPIARIIDPQLSTVHYPAEEMGERAVQSLIDHLSGKSNIHEAETMILPYKLIVRGTSLPKA